MCSSRAADSSKALCVIFSHVSNAARLPREIFQPSTLHLRTLDVCVCVLRWIILRLAAFKWIFVALLLSHAAFQTCLFLHKDADTL